MHADSASLKGRICVLLAQDAVFGEGYVEKVKAKATGEKRKAAGPLDDPELAAEVEALDIEVNALPLSVSCPLPASETCAFTALSLSCSLSCAQYDCSSALRLSCCPGSWLRLPEFGLAGMTAAECC